MKPADRISAPHISSRHSFTQPSPIQLAYNFSPSQSQGTPFRQVSRAQDKLDEWLATMIDKDWIHPVKYKPKHCLKLFQLKKRDGGLRTIVDCKPLNRIIDRDKTESLNAFGIIQKAVRSKYVAKIDLRDAYYNIRIKREAQTNFGFRVGRHGQDFYKE
eukprot:Protomagalhaensia_wolfi_Nauph_80__1959@NODE_2237_length_1158_cov_13_355675_g1747_i0_p1_GENE_NODE_2237_length_1158_cov_13_355675_g1747_i0NODE_2237_length_1158_cov_13_355675_g1747_i0_p1_ORF_typecomplete_len159_score16_39RVT_1/PF00078_27/0_0012RdDM_RDM1/PF09187_10/0_021_NODE_2237_length_1158_cov_13_355675_g1747_i0439915